jgi:DNA-binding NarL/FixJ family response regulator
MAADQLHETALPDEVVLRLRRLTPREKEILDLLASGWSTSAIASKLYISQATVRNHVQHILAKLGVHGRLEAILALFRGRERGAALPQK